MIFGKHYSAACAFSLAKTCVSSTTSQNQQGSAIERLILLEGCVMERSSSLLLHVRCLMLHT